MNRHRPRTKITTVLLLSTLLAALAIGSLEVIRLSRPWRFEKFYRARAVIGEG